MGKYLKEKCDSSEDLRKSRKEFYQFFIVAWFLIALSVALARVFPSPAAGSWTIGQLLVIAIGIAAFIFAIKCFIKMKTTIAFIYNRSTSFFVLYLVLLVGGFATGILWIIPLILIWVHSKKLIATK